MTVNGWYGSDIIIQCVHPSLYSWEVNVGVGYRDWVTSRCSTKAILAFLDDKQLLRYFASRAHPATTERTITDFEPFRCHLLEVAERGYALDLGETTHNWCGAAAPFFTSSGFPLGSFGIPIPQEAFDQEQDSMIRAVTDAAIETSRALGYTGSYPPPSPLLRQNRSSDSPCKRRGD